MRLATSGAAKALLLLCLAASLCDEANATFGNGETLNVVSGGTECGVSIALLDVWAGVSSFTDGFGAQQYVVVRQRGWIEWSDVASLLLSIVYNTVLWCKDFYSSEWRSWKFGYDLVVTAGPSCCPFSVSGKRKRQDDSRSSQGMDTAEMSLHLGALVLIIENVTGLVDDDHLHGVFSETDAYLQAGGMCLVGLWRLCDGCMGGCTGRQRVFPCWEKAEMASCLPPWSDEPMAMTPGSLREMLQPWEAIEHLAVRGQSKFVLGVKTANPGVSASQHCSAEVVGTLHIRGHKDKWMPGEGIRLQGDERTWRVLEVTRRKLKIFLDSRRNPEFRWMWQSELSFDQRCWIEWPVLSIDGVAKAIRHTSFAPGDLFLDDRRECALVRPLSNREKWEIMGLSGHKAQLLEDRGLSGELGQLAGNSVPHRMATAVAAEASSRIAKFNRLKEARGNASYVSMQPLAGLQLRQLAATFLVVLCLQTQGVWLWDGRNFPGMVHDASQQQSFDLACVRAEQLGVEQAAKHAVLLERPMGNSRARAIVCFAQHLDPPRNADLIRVVDITAPEARELAAAALAQVMRMKVTVQAGTTGNAWQSGRVTGTAAHQTEMRTKGAPAEFSLQIERHERAQSQLDSLLKNDASPDMADWRARLAPNNLDEVPDSLKVPVGNWPWCALELP